MSARLCAAFLLLVATVACQRETKRKPKQEAPAEAALAAPSEAPTPSDTSSKPPGEEALVAFPKYSGEEVSAAKANRSRILNTSALVQLRAKLFDEATPLFIKSLEYDPGNVLARYNLACNFNLAGQRASALLALRQLREAGTRSSLAQVLGAPHDKDFQSALTDPAFIELTSGIQVESPTMPELAKLVMDAFDAEDVTTIAPYVHASRATRFAWADGFCDSDVDPCGGVKKHYGLAAFTKKMKAITSIGKEELAEVSFTTGDEVGECDDRCCHYNIEGISHSTYWLSDICFYQRAGFLFIDELQTIDEN
jgi:hypothetical protein